MDLLNKVLGKDSSSAAKIALLATAVVASGAVAYYMFAGSKDDDLLPAVHEEEAVEIMTQILDKIKTLIPKMLRAAEGIKQQLSQQGQEIDDLTLMKTFILPHVKEQYEAIQASVLETYDYDDDEVEEAVNYYIAHGNEKLVDLRDKIRSIYKEFGGEVDMEESEPSQTVQKMSEEDVVKLMLGLQEKMENNTEMYCRQYVDTFGTPTTQQSMEQFQGGLMQVADGAEKELLGELGLNQMDFQNILTQYQHNKRVIEIFTTMQYDNRRILAKHGITMGMGMQL